MARVTRLEPVYRERIWGTTNLAPYFPNPDRKIGEVWFQPSDQFPLLIKFLFTSERLSVQVHPEDAYALERENSRGKTEMWHILAVEPDATIALGFRERVSEAQIRKAIGDGTLEQLLNWVPVQPGEAYFAEAGVVHAIGGGIVLCEIQQNSDVTYRLYDYNRPRELHVEKSLAVAKLEPYDGRRQYPVTCQYFTTELLQATQQVLPDKNADSVVVVLAGTGQLDGERFEPGQAWLLPGNAGDVEVQADSSATLLRASC